MKGKRFSEEQMIGILKEWDAGANPKEVARRYGVTDKTLYNWKRKYGGMQVSEAKRLRALEAENSKLKRVVADMTLDILALRDLVSGKL